MPVALQLNVSKLSVYGLKSKQTKLTLACLHGSFSNHDNAVVLVLGFEATHRTKILATNCSMWRFLE